VRALIQTAVGGPEVLTVGELPMPVAAPGELLVRVTAAGLNFHDVEARRRGEPGLRLPAVPGTDVVGVVEDVGRGVTGFAVGDRVLALSRHGACAEYATVPAQTAGLLPAGMDDALAACVPTTGLTAWFLVRDHLPPGARWVVCHAAAGGVGLWLGALIARSGVGSVGVVSCRAKADLALAAGHRRVVDRTEEPDVVRAVRRSTGGRGASVVYDAVAGARFGDSFQVLQPGGTVILYGRAGGAPDLADIPATFLDARRNLGLRTWYLGRALTLFGRDVPGALTELTTLLASGDICMPVAELPLRDAAQAHRLLESGATMGKVVFRP